MLQDRVDPRPFAETQAMLERELGAPVAELFADLEEQPCAAASLAQVAVFTYDEAASGCGAAAPAMIEFASSTGVPVMCDRAAAACGMPPSCSCHKLFQPG